MIQQGIGGSHHGAVMGQSAAEDGIFCLDNDGGGDKLRALALNTARRLVAQRANLLSTPSPSPPKSGSSSRSDVIPITLLAQQHGQVGGICVCRSANGCAPFACMCF